MYFLIGIGSYLALDHARRLPQIGAFAVLAGAASVIGLTGSYIAASWILIYAALCVCPGISQVLTARPLVFLGKISFSIYLVHMIVLVLVQYGIVHRLFAFRTWSYFMALSLVTVPVTIALSCVTYRWIEEPFIRLGKTRLAYRAKAA